MCLKKIIILLQYILVHEFLLIYLTFLSQSKIIFQIIELKS